MKSALPEDIWIREKSLMKRLMKLITSIPSAKSVFSRTELHSPDRFGRAFQSYF